MASNNEERSNNNQTIKKRKNTTEKCKKISKTEIQKLERNRINNKWLEVMQEKYSNLDNEWAFAGINDRFNDPYPYIDTLIEAEKIVEWAARNIHHPNLLLREWSEAVLLQICKLDEALQFDTLSWNEARKIAQTNTYNINVTAPLKCAWPRGAIFIVLLEHNRANKHNSFGCDVSNTMMFYSRPYVNYSILKSYTPPKINTCTRTLNVDK